jgi:N-acetylmuramoyl-L-alanine amidase CwlA
MKNHILDEVTIGSAKVIVDILPKGKVIPDVLMVTNFITIHNTGNIGAPAKNNHNYMKNCNKNGDRIASWHFTVDDKEIYQAAPANMRCYHAGTSRGNNTSIGIEICMFNDKERQRKAYLNAIELVKILMKQYNLSIDKVRQHYAWTKKDCPAWLRSGKFGFTWTWFTKQIGETLPSNNKEDDDTFLVKVLVDDLNVRTGPSTDYRVVSQVHKGEVYTIVKVSGNWGRLKSGVGWISIHSKYVKKV